MSKLYLFFSGIIIGIGVVLPGVSGSILAIILGIYDFFIYVLNDNNKKIINKIINLFPLLLGLIIGVVLFSNIILIFYNKYNYEMMYIFMGLILAEIPILLKDVEKKGRINFKYLIFSTVISLILVVFPNIFNNYEKNINSPFILFIAGILYISGKIIPGISSSLFLMILGLYNYILEIISNPLSLSIIEYIHIIPFFIGCIIGFLILIKLINYLLINHFSETYSCIIGFIISSVCAIYPGIRFDVVGLKSIVLMSLSFILVNKLSKKK